MNAVSNLNAMSIRWHSTTIHKLHGGNLCNVVICSCFPSTIFSGYTIRAQLEDEVETLVNRGHVYFCIFVVMF